MTVGIGLADLARVLNMGPPIGAWFAQTEEVVGFAPQKRGAMRPVILRHWDATGAIAFVFARTTKDYRVEVSNPGHNHRDGWPKCWLKDDGNVIVSRPLPIAKDDLDEEHRLCFDDDQATIDAVKRARWQTK